MKYKAVIFDLYGTLIDNYTRPEYERVLKEMARILNAPADKFSRLWFESFRKRNTGELPTPQANIRCVCAQLNVPVNDTQVEAATRVRLDYSRRTMVPRPGTLETLSRLKSAGIRTALISDCSSETALVWPDTALAPLFDVILLSCVVGIKKPDPRIYRMATEQLGVEPGECLYIGDGSSQELTGALKVGMHPVLLNYPDESADAHTIDREPDWRGPTISSVTEVLDLLDLSPE